MLIWVHLHDWKQEGKILRRIGIVRGRIRFSTTKKSLKRGVVSHLVGLKKVVSYLDSLKRGVVSHLDGL